MSLILRVLQDRTGFKVGQSLKREVAAYLFLGLLLLCISCGGSSGTNNPLQVPASQAVPPDTLITLERTGCDGACPIYTLKISADGTIIFEGRNFVRKAGKTEGSVTQNQLRQIIAAFDKANYFSLKDKYAGAEDGCPTTWTDYPSAVTFIKINGKSKTISHNYGCRETRPDKSLGDVYPKELFELEKTIDEIAGTGQWIK
jgi:Domain of unknown function (DUF6438)